jgi:thiosulfate/3-mercaptopyruvate sulfurtransferase
VDAAWLTQRLDDPAVVLIDTRSPEEFAGTAAGSGPQEPVGHIPGATNIFWEDLLTTGDNPRYRPVDDLRAWFDAAGVGPDSTVVVYGATGLRASTVYFASRLLGYQTRLYDGAWHDWTTRGLPVETGP